MNEKAPPADVDVTDKLIDELIRSQFPDLADLPRRKVGNGWDNVTIRLGAALAARIPRRKLGAELIAVEQRWLPVVAGGLDVETPQPVSAGFPTDSYPYRWSIVAWVEGETAERSPLAAGEAKRFGRVLRSIHVPAPPNAPRNAYRGVPLESRSAGFEQRLADLAGRVGSVDLSSVSTIWQEACDAPIDVDQTWLHGDLHPRNVIGRNGEQAGLIDWGDMCVGDPATDLAAAWMQFDSPVDVFSGYGGLSEATLQRARGWAAFFGVFLSEAGLFLGDSGFLTTGRSILERITRRG